MVFSSEAKVTRSKFLPTTFPLFYATSTPTITYTLLFPRKIMILLIKFVLDNSTHLLSYRVPFCVTQHYDMNFFPKIVGILKVNSHFWLFDSHVSSCYFGCIYTCIHTFSYIFWGTSYNYNSLCLHPSFHHLDIGITQINRHVFLTVWKKAQRNEK